VRHTLQLAPGTLDFTTFTWPGLLRRLRQMAITGAGQGAVRWHQGRGHHPNAARTPKGA
jgi:hypothetical protein